MANLEFINGNYFEIDRYPNIFDNVDFVFHLVHTTIVSTSMKDIPYDIETNVIPSVKLLNMSLKYNIKKFIFISSGGTVYGIPQHIPVSEEHPKNPISSYGITKLSIEKYINMFNHIYNFNGYILRLSNPYGIKQYVNKLQGVIPIFLNSINKNQKIEIWGDGEVIRDFIYIQDVCKAIEKIIQKEDMPPGVFNIGSGTGYSLNDIVKIIKDIVDIDFEVSYNAGRKIDVPKIVLSIDKIKRYIDWKPCYDIKKGISEIWKKNIIQTIKDL